MADTHIQINLDGSTEERTTYELSINTVKLQKNEEKYKNMLK